jgi:hypothetical protein
MRHTPTLAVATIISLTFGIAGPTCHAVAQETLHVSFKVPAENSKYTQQVNLNVTGSPNHIMRAYELHRTYPGNPPVIGGLKLVESWEQGIGDRFDGNGDGTSYTAFVLDNGDKFYVRNSLLIQNVSGKTVATTVGRITGGTGKLAGIQGVVRSLTNFDIKTGFNEGTNEIDYSIGN